MPDAQSRNPGSAGFGRLHCRHSQFGCDRQGKPLSDVKAKLGQPSAAQTIAGQKAYIWNVGNTLYACQIRVVMAGDVVDTYEGSGDVHICAQYMVPFPAG